LVSGKRALENAGLGGDDLNKVTAWVTVSSKYAGYSTFPQFQSIFSDFAWSN
jgi:hypothetical protein